MSKANSGLIFDLRRYSVNDGPGIRTTIFLKGCPLQCAWCHNPESQKHSIESIIRSRQMDGKQFLQKFPCGYYATPDQMINEISKDILCFEESNGGVTLSGGEPLSQPTFLFELMKLTKEYGIHTTLDTCGEAPKTVYNTALNLADLILFDVKCISEDLHLTYTKRSNKTILSNLIELSSSLKPYYIRIPIIPKFNDNERELSLIHQFIQTLPNKPIQIDLLPFHSIGIHKYHELRRTLPSLHPLVDSIPNMTLANSIIKQ